MQIFQANGLDQQEKAMECASDYASDHLGRPLGYSIFFLMALIRDPIY